MMPDPTGGGALLGGGVLLAWVDVQADQDAEFNNWYTHEHIPERAGIPGFLRARRYRRGKLSPGTEGVQEYFTLYETESLAVLSSPAYLERLNNPTDWTSQAVKSLYNLNRTAAHVEWSLGSGFGAFVSTVEIAPRDAATVSTALRGLCEHVIAAEPAVTGAHLFRGDEKTTRQKDTTEEGDVLQTSELSALNLTVEGHSDIEAVLASALAASDVVVGKPVIKSYAFMYGELH